MSNSPRRRSSVRDLMTDTEITHALRDFLVREFPKREKAIRRLSAQDPLDELGVLDSLGMLTLAAFVEARWGVKIPARAFETSFATLRSTEAAIEAHRR
jgi:acyl carrier protein